MMTQLLSRSLGAAILAGLTIGLGFILCIAPGIIFAIWYVFVSQVVVVEGLKAEKAMSRSKELTSGYRGLVWSYRHKMPEPPSI